ncbi:SMI1/KNR4 family protein [Nocardia sp. NPDC004415]
MSDLDNQSTGKVAHLANQIWATLTNRGFEPPLRRGDYPASRYEALVGEPAPAEAAVLWSVLGGRDVLGLWFESAWSAGELCDARATEAEFSGPGVPYEELDGSAANSVRMVWWDRGWCPVMATADIAFAIDTNPGATGHRGQIIFCSLHEDCDREAVWNSLADFLRDVLTVVSSDGLVIENGFGHLAHTDGYNRSVPISILEVGRAHRDGRRIQLHGLSDAV